MLSASTMALAAMLGSTCGANVAVPANMTPAMYNGTNCPQNVCFQNNCQDLNACLQQLGACIQDGSCSVPMGQGQGNNCGLRR